MPSKSRVQLLYVCPFITCNCRLYTFTNANGYLENIYYSLRTHCLVWPSLLHTSLFRLQISCFSFQLNMHCMCHNESFFVFVADNLYMRREKVLKSQSHLRPEYKPEKRQPKMNFPLKNWTKNLLVKSTSLLRDKSAKWKHSANIPENCCLLCWFTSQDESPEIRSVYPQM